MNAIGIFAVQLIKHPVKAVKENAVKSIPPLLLKGTPQELDEGFFDAVVEPLLQTETLIQNIADYQMAQEKVKTISTGSKTKTGAQKCVIHLVKNNCGVVVARFVGESVDAVM